MAIQLPNNRRNTNIAVSLIFLRSEDNGESWQPITDKEVPDWIKKNDLLMAEVAGGAQITNPALGDNNLYQAHTENEIRRLGGQLAPMITIATTIPKKEILH